MKMAIMYSTTIVALVLLSCQWVTTTAQNCGCSPDLCCSKYGYCGSNDSYCGEGCQAGPCRNQPTNSGITVSDVVTDDFFNGIINKAAGTDCPGRGFYTRSAFLAAVDRFNRFGTVGSTDDSKREIAAFFAHVTHETGHMCSIEGDKSQRHCEVSDEWRCVDGKSYYERGPLQLVGNLNYGPAGAALGFDGLNDPDIVARDPEISFKASMWFWMTFCHDSIVAGRGFGSTIRAMNGGLECGGKNPSAVSNRVNYYTGFCSQLGVDPGTNLSC